MTIDQHIATPVDQLIAEEWARTFPDFDLPSFVRTGALAFEIARDTSLHRERREASRQIGLGVTAKLLELLDAARARLGHGVDGAAQGKMSAQPRNIRCLS